MPVTIENERPEILSSAILATAKQNPDGVWTARERTEDGSKWLFYALTPDEVEAYRKMKTEESVEQAAKARRAQDSVTEVLLNGFVKPSKENDTEIDVVARKIAQIFGKAFVKSKQKDYAKSSDARFGLTRAACFELSARAGKIAEMLSEKIEAAFTALGTASENKGVKVSGDYATWQIAAEYLGVTVGAAAKDRSVVHAILEFKTGGKVSEDSIELADM